MDKNIGFRRNIHRSWLDAAAAITAEESDPVRVRERLDPIVAERIASKPNRRMALDILLNIWFKSAETHSALHAEALALYQESEVPDDRLWLHYGLTLLSYPFFRLGTATIGQLSTHADVIMSKDLKKRLAAELGQLGALEKAAACITFSLRDWGILVPAKQRYAYAPRLHNLTTENVRVQLWLLAAALTAHPADALPFADLVRLPELFPFRITVGVEDLRRSPRFEVHREGMAWDMISLRHERSRKRAPAARKHTGRGRKAASATPSRSAARSRSKAS